MASHVSSSENIHALNSQQLQAINNNNHNAHLRKAASPMVNDNVKFSLDSSNNRHTGLLMSAERTGGLQEMSSPLNH